ncbi:MAG: CRISPR-associated endonuclease Cas2 [Bacteroidales bacterium]|jgi:CRISPR-associated protein Cas2|nr:CRISPR-associated endonuclease Cas2 [Bacteroidales bacterium]
MIEFNRLNAYHIMWLFVFFDLPTNTKKERKAAARFRKDIMQDGFTMMQYSVYVRHCASKESGDVHCKRIKDYIPEKGQISIMSITDKQYGDIINYWGAKEKPLPSGPKQLEIF